VKIRFKAYFSDTKNFTIGNSFTEEIDSSQRYRVTVKPEDEKQQYNAAALRVHCLDFKPFKGRFTLKGSKVNRSFVTYDGINYYVRMNPKEELTNDTYIEAEINGTAEVRIEGHYPKYYFPLDDGNPINGDYLGKGEHICYDTSYFKDGGTLIIETAVTDLNLYVNYLTRPETLDQYQYKYMNKEFPIIPSVITAPAIALPIKEAETTYFCIEGVNKSLSFSYATLDNQPLIISHGQTIKLYLEDDVNQFVGFSDFVRRNSPLKLNFKSIEGCTDVLLKTRTSFYAIFLMRNNQSEGISPFDYVYEKDTEVFRVQNTGDSVTKTIEHLKKDTLCTGSDVYSECPSAIFVKSCNKGKRSVITIELEETTDPSYILGKPELIFMSPNKKRVGVIPDVAPEIETVSLILEQMPLFQPIKKGILTLEQAHGSIKEIVELDGSEQKITVSIKNKESNYQGDYYVTIESIEEVNIRIRSKMYATINGKEEEIVNIRRASLQQGLELQPVNESYQYAYFTLYTKNEPGTEMILSFELFGNIKNKTIKASKKPWPENYEWVSNTEEHFKNMIRIPRGGSYYYIKIEGEPNFNTENYEYGGNVYPLILESQRYDTLEVNKSYTFTGTRLFKFPARTGYAYFIRKISKSPDAMYVSLTSNNVLPFTDKHDWILDPNLSGEDEEPKESVIEISYAQTLIEHLNQLKEIRLTVNSYTGASYYHLYIEETIDNDYKNNYLYKSDL